MLPLLLHSLALTLLIISPTAPSLLFFLTSKPTAFEDLPLEWWERTSGCKEAKANHMAYVDRVMDGWVGEGGEGGTGSNSVSSSSSSSSSSASSSSSSGSSSSSSVVVNEHHHHHPHEQQQQQPPQPPLPQRTQQQRIRDGRERLVLLTTMCERDIVMELNMFPYACPEVRNVFVMSEKTVRVYFSLSLL